MLFRSATVNSLTAEEDAEGAAGRCPRVNFHLTLFLSRAYNRLLRHQGIILWKRIENPQLPFFKRPPVPIAVVRGAPSVDG